MRTGPNDFNTRILELFPCGIRAPYQHGPQNPSPFEVSRGGHTLYERVSYSTDPMIRGLGSSACTISRLLRF